MAPYFRKKLFVRKLYLFGYSRWKLKAHLAKQFIFAFYIFLLSKTIFHITFFFYFFQCLLFIV